MCLSRAVGFAFALCILTVDVLSLHSFYSMMIDCKQCNYIYSIMLILCCSTVILRLFLFSHFPGAMSFTPNRHSELFNFRAAHAPSLDLGHLSLGSNVESLGLPSASSAPGRLNFSQKAVSFDSKKQL